MRLNNVFENIKERMIREDSKDNYELPINRGKGKEAAFVIAWNDKFAGNASDVYKEALKKAKEGGYSLSEGDGDFWQFNPVASLDTFEYTRMIAQLAPIADAIFVDERVYNELDYIEQNILVAGMSLINIDIYEAKSGYRCKPDPIYVNEIQKALAKRVELSTMAKDPVYEIASRAILYELIIVMCHIWKCVRVKYDIR